MAKQTKKPDTELKESKPVKAKKETKPKAAAKASWPEAEEVTVSKKAAPKKATEKKPAAAKKTNTLQIIENTELKAVEPYSRFTDFDIDLFKSGKHFKLYEKFGSHVVEHKGVVGTYFAVWAPNAQYVAVIGNFNGWNKGSHSLNYRWDASGIWEGFIPNIGVGETYKYYIKSSTGEDLEKSDPFALRWELPPRTASIVADTFYEWKDQDWMATRYQHTALDKPHSVYEMHLGSWARSPESPEEFLSYRQLAETLVPYVKDMGFTHVEFMPLMEHPYYPSWGYQITGFFAASCRYGTPQDLMYLIEEFHKAGIGVILDWVPSHFPGDAHGLYNFDGTHLYEHADLKKGFHPDWKSYIFNYGRNEVRAFLISNALFWLERFHIDGLRVDAVASMLYLDYSRNHGEWDPNEFGGNENLEAISFLKEFNTTVYSNFPDVQTIAEESTSFAGVSRPVYTGGLGFGMKWMMGWMHDTLDYFKQDPIYRKYHQNQLTFSMVYAFTENFMLPFSHDEVVYGKGSMLNKMPGDDWQKFANLRLLYSFMYTHPGTKLLFMGSEFGQVAEWNYKQSLDWHLLEHASHQGLKEAVKAINYLYKNEPALYEKSFDWTGFEWIDAGNLDDSILIYTRKGVARENELVIVLNMTPVPHYNYRVGVPAAGEWQEIFNSDSEKFWGSGIINFDAIASEPTAWHGRDNSIAVTTPPLGAAIFKKVIAKQAVKKTKKLK
ncbi:1,4-alpha-glucan branching protein GlgB [Mucilaginibacter phyllosphaerae]|uniref:1,4-alpha-glucan branching enzyme GlgB n=1 Tax=Mucilaginibacter phyllosphaerae TaxID=1812349 RepID=A0A4Y8A9I1_9SPHI|nr:1,4-alpha-glucan branching protein GlgB [Mucilaginibacter phyllosphaerae]MBB3970531.1 1,4-alpha-glucan branching enzyme [Mucilaginibacter phyllosphaerae]TEW64544.1 1,4-alpha-glucan branching protein GlgB [Mucilaginibacter phyllosphaerae]GGH19351.1 1,4-alpha-glucan branching enzyme GlgB [Mucilaginibacter phyllosphaerae]